MKTFKFQLATVLQYKKQIEEERKRELATAQKKVIEQQARIDSIIKLTAGATDDLRKLVSAAVRIQDVLAQKRYQRALEIKLLNSRNELKALGFQEARKRAELLKATKERKILDKLKEKKYRDYLYQLNIEERKFLDEIATVKFCNSLNNKQDAAYA